MRFGFSDEQAAIAETARDLLAVRRGAEGLWDEICELGWPGIAVAEEFGGQGLGAVELAIVAEQLGFACASTPFLGTTLAALAIEAGGPSGGETLLGELATGRRLGALALAGERSLVPDAGADRLLVLIDGDRGGVLMADAVEDVEAIDPGRRHGRLVSDPADGVPLAEPPVGALDRARIIVAAELVGLCRKALELTVSYVAVRRQFGVPIGSFQAVQHAAAQMLRDTESAAATTYGAAWVADHDPSRLAEAAAMAKASASAAGRAVTAAAMQLHGGVGFTWEAEPHWLYKRAQVDAMYLGGVDFHHAALARMLGADQRRPTHDRRPECPKP